MRPPVSATFAVWANAWLGGAVGFDDVLDAVTVGTEVHLIVDLPASQNASHGRGDGSAGFGREGSRPEPARLGAVLIAWRAAGAPVRACLPVPGDVRGTPTSPPFLAAALDAGQAVFAGGIGLVPGPPTDTPSSAPPVTVWQAFPVDPGVPDPVQLSEAEHDLAVAVRETATLLRERDLTGGRPPDARELERVRRASEGLRLPAGFPPRAAALLASAERLQAMINLAAQDVHGGAIDRHGVETRTTALTQLATTVRRARLAGYNAVRP
jgi:hypothetical protein